MPYHWDNLGLEGPHRDRGRQGDDLGLCPRGNEGGGGGHNDKSGEGELHNGWRLLVGELF